MSWWIPRQEQCLFFETLYFLIIRAPWWYELWNNLAQPALAFFALLFLSLDFFISNWLMGLWTEILLISSMHAPDSHKAANSTLSLTGIYFIERWLNGEQAESRCRWSGQGEGMPVLPNCLSRPKSDQEGLLEKEKDPLGLIFPSTYVSACMEEILFTLCVWSSSLILRWFFIALLFGWMIQAVIALDQASQPLSSIHSGSPASR